MVDMLVRLYALPEGSPLRSGLAEQGVLVRPCRPFEMHAVEEWIARTFSTRWVSEFQVAMAHQPCGCIIATHEHKVVGFACYDATARGFLGPMGLSESARGTGVGKVLLVTALEHIRRAVSMEPDNPEYLQVLEEIQNGGAAYRRQAGNFRGFTMRGDPCMNLCLCYLAQMLCCGRPYLFCC